MPHFDVEQAMQRAINSHQRGKLAEAEVVYGQVIAAVPEHADALHLLGVIRAQGGRHHEAAELIGRAILAGPGRAEFHCHLAMSLDELGRAEEAILQLQTALTLHPNYAEAHKNLGRAHASQKDYDKAIASYARALALDPTMADAHNNLGNTHQAMGNFPGALASYSAALAIEPDYVDALYNKGLVLSKLGDLKQAAACYEKVIAIAPTFFAAHLNLGSTLRQLGYLELATTSLLRAAELRPDSADVHNNLGNLWMDRVEPTEAIASYRRALALNPNFVEALSNLGNAFRASGRMNESLACHGQALALSPDSLGVLINLGNAQKDSGLIDEAMASYRRALAISPVSVEAQNNLGNAQKDIGLLDEAMASYRRAMTINPDFIDAHDNLILSMLYHPDTTAETMALECARWDRQHAVRYRPPKEKSHANSRDPQRRLRIGYVSPDFRQHPAGRCVLPLVEGFDRGQFDVICYAQVSAPDEISARFQAAATLWRNICARSDEQVAAMVREDKIDILVDLALHTANNRLLVFARKPAPIQVSFAGYPGITGLETMDYRITDSVLDPATQSEPDFEKPVRLEHPFWYFQLLGNEPEIQPPPAASADHVTFGNLNNFCKVNAGVLDLWGEVLRAVPGSKLLLLARAGNVRERVLEHFSRDGVAADRIEFASYAPRAGYLAHYQRIDIGLDTFPYTGQCTSLDSFWMGVPVVTLAGETTISRAGESQLAQLGLRELIGQSKGDYVRIATELAGDFQRLSALRAGLRARMMSSRLMDARGLALEIENAYRLMWLKWCGAISSPPS